MVQNRKWRVPAVLALGIFRQAVLPPGNDFMDQEPLVGTKPARSRPKADKIGKKGN